MNTVDLLEAAYNLSSTLKFEISPNFQNFASQNFVKIAQL